VFFQVDFGSELSFCAFFESRKTTIEIASRKLRKRNIPAYRRLVAKITLLTIGPSVCPMSIVVDRNPIDAPTSEAGTKSQTQGEVEERTVANETP